MTPKERVIAAICHKEPDLVPSGENQIDGKLAEEVLGRPQLCNMGWREIKAIWNGRREDVVRDYCRVHVELPQALSMDYVRVPVVPPVRDYTQQTMTNEYSWINEAGAEYSLIPDSGTLFVRSHYPEMNVANLPDPDMPYSIDPSELEAIRYVVKELGPTHFIIGRSPVDGTFPWEHTVGMESFLTKMISDPIFVEKAMMVYVNRSIAYIRAMIEEGVDAVMTVDDYSDNRGPIMGPELFRKFVLPGIKKQVDLTHKLGVYFIKHTDGNVWAILDDLVESGIDGWHGIQRKIGMDLALLKQRYGRDLCFFGGVDTETMISNTPKEIREEVYSAIKLCARGGGLVISCSNVVAPGSKLENLLAMRRAIWEYGAC